MSMNVADPAQANPFPAVDAAYAFVIPSYQLLTSRFESADSRLTALLTVTLTLTLGAPVFARGVNPAIAFDAPVFLLGVSLAVACFVLGMWGRVTGHLILPDPMVIHDKSLRRSDSSFKMSQIYFAGENFSANARAIHVKGNIAIAMMFLMAWEVALLVIWLSQ